MRALLALSLTLVVAACGSGDSSAGMATQPPASDAPVRSVAPTPGGGSPSASQPAALGHAAPDLEAQLPGRVAGTALSKSSGTGSDVFQDDPWSRQMTQFLAGVGRTPADLRFAQAFDPADNLDLELGAFQVDGVDAASLRTAIVDSSRAGSPGLSTGATVLSGKPLTTVLYPASTATLYLYEHDGVVFYAGTSDPALAAEALAALP